jgi:hypothetical protein
MLADTPSARLFLFSTGSGLHQEQARKRNLTMIPNLQTDCKHSAGIPVWLAPKSRIGGPVDPLILPQYAAATSIFAVAGGLPDGE